ncbi:glycoside hydrolase family 31 protein [Hymenobacter sp. M29]|uniref:Glycoside hydrolase family 31 protein n=1 Tax=Hymenobacter mellowenesis TaxID=3063995 RepID=A0ABT9AK40_9BACT|nr:TIM-barrel domain-containing protein [Hymenobacter sp. M29]MDO7849426.1 glycoside hydrolase family 31 protein [Hymenobacter sp. M29]
MKVVLRAFGSVAALVAVFLAPDAYAQRANDGQPAQDPFGRRVLPARAVPGGRYRSHSFRNGMLVIDATDGSTIRVRPWDRHVVRVEYAAPDQRSYPDSTAERAVAVMQRPDTSAVPGANADNLDGKTLARLVRNSRQELVFALPGALSFRAVVHKNPLRVSIVDGADTLVSEVRGAFRRITARASAPEAPGPEPGGVGVRFRLAPGEQLYGTGSRALPVDRRGYRLELYNQAHYGSQNNEPNLNIALPTVLSSRGYMLFFDNHAPGYLDLGKTDKNVLEYGGEGLTSLSYFVITGRNQAEILGRYTTLTGRQPLPPRWALGLIQSRFGYKSDGEMQNVAARMRRENFPLDALVLDLYWFGGTTRQGDLSWDKTHFPDPAGMMSSLNKQGVKTILISEPYVMRTSRNDSTVRTRGLVGTTAAGQPFTVASFWAGPANILDVFRPRTRDWLWGYYKKLHDEGAAGWWSDLGEPENHPAAMQHAPGPARAVHNAYGQSWAGILSEGYARDFPDERVFNLARSGWAGMQRNAVFPWSGDINRSWSGFQAQVPVMVGMGQGGVGYMHSDAGGFCVGGIDPELYTRWLQMASLCPILRPHGEGVPPEPYYYPDPYKSSVRDAVHLRYQLLPYLYTLAWQNTARGLPLVRATDFNSGYGRTPPPPPSKAEYQAEISTDDGWGPPKDRERFYRDVVTSSPSDSPLKTLPPPNDQYLLGPNLLVAPVLHPSQRRRNVLLPSGNWIDFYTNQTYAGNRVVGVPAPLAHTPLLVRGGAFLPMTAYRPSTALYRPDTLLLRYYPDPSMEESEFTMYDDEGHSAQALTRRQYETLTMRGFCTPEQTDVILSSNGEYPGQPVFRYVRLLVQRVAAPPTAIYFDEKPVPAEGFSYDPVKHELEVHFLMNAGVDVSLRGLKILPATAADAAPETLTLEGPDSRSFGPGGTTLRYSRLASRAAGPGQLRIRNAQGAVVRTLPLDAAPGPHALPWDARDDALRPLPPGVYVAEAAGQHQRLIVTR